MKSILVLLASLLVADAVTAQSTPVWTKDTYFNTYHTSKMAMADLSGDGKVDLISAEQIDFGSFRITCRPNNGSGLFPNFTVLRSYAAPSPNYVFKDMDTINVDGTGVMELAVSYSAEVSGNTTYHVDILQMSGSILTLIQTINVPSGGAQLVKSGYFDGVEDNVKKLGDLAVGSGSFVYIYSNNGVPNPYFGGSGGTPNFTIQASGMTTIQALNVGEFYNSGYGNDQNAGFNEIILAENDVNIRRWKNNTPASGASWFVQQSGDPLVNSDGIYQPYNYRSIHARDMNGDGLQDFLYEPGIRLNTSGNPMSWPPPATYPYVWVPSPYESRYAKSSTWADINNDGKMDVVACYHDAIDYHFDFPFICYNDGANNLPDEMVDVDFISSTDPYFGEDRTAMGMTLLTGDVSGLGAVSIARITEENTSPWKDNKIVVYRRTDNPAPAPPVLIYVGKNTPTSNLIRVSWNRNPEADVTLYEVWRGFSTSPDIMPASWALRVSVTGTSWIEEDFVIGDKWSHSHVHYKIKAKDAQNQFSALSNSMSVPVGPMLPKTGGEARIPFQFRLSQNSPNPFNPTTSISYEIPESDHVTLKIYNVMGQEVATLVDENQEAGIQEVIWNGKDDAGHEAPSGVYVYRLQAGSQTITMKMNLLK